MSKDIDKETVKITLTVTFQTEDGSPIGNLDCDLEDDLIRALERHIEEGMLTEHHDELLVDEYNIEAKTEE